METRKQNALEILVSASLKRAGSRQYKFAGPGFTMLGVDRRSRGGPLRTWRALSWPWFGFRGSREVPDPPASSSQAWLVPWRDPREVHSKACRDRGKAQPETSGRGNRSSGLGRAEFQELGQRVARITTDQRV